MLNARSKGNENIIQFFCPKCGKEDIKYLQMPRHCHHCGALFDFDPEALRDSRIERHHYYLYGRTTAVFRCQI